MSLTFLSEEWLAALGAELAGAPPLEGEGSLHLGYVVLADDGRGERLSYTIELVGGQPPLLAGTGTEGAEVTLVQSEGTARALASGEVRAGELLEAGAIKIRGDGTALRRAVDLLEQLARSSGALAERTDFS